MTRDEHLFGKGPKRILALDGGGIRGVLSIQVLRRIEALLRERRPAPERAAFRLCDYFDLIGGTSTGAIIATGLALGMAVDELDALYRRLGGEIFDERWFRKGLLRAKFSEKPLRAALKSAFGDATLGGAELRTGLAIVTKRIDTGSPWVLHNNPRGRHYSERDDDGAVANADYRLRDIVRASTAAPHYFDPERIAVAKGRIGAFVDGGVSPHNNPSLQLLMLATLKGFGLGWPAGDDQLLLVSVGTGGKARADDAAKLLRGNPIALAVNALASLMDDAAALNETLLQWLSRSPTARPIDVEIGDLRGDLLAGKPLLEYLRYDVQLDRTWLEQRLGLSLSEAQLLGVEKMDDPRKLPRLVEIGEAAQRLVRESHFPPRFDVVRQPA